LFCGPGGMDLGFEQAGFQVILALDHDEASVKTYNLNRGREVARKWDISSLKCDEFLDMVRKLRIRPRGVIAGPPCQSFSRGNTNKKRKDPRANLAVAYAKLVGALNHEFGLDFFLFENVIGLRGANHRNRFAQIRREFRSAGFNLFQAELDAQDFGVAQRRRRLIIVGINSEKYSWLDFKFSQGDKKAKTVREVIEHLPQPIFFRRNLIANEITVHQNHWTMNPRSPKFVNQSKVQGRSFRRLEWDKPSFTVAYGNREIHVHPQGNRRLSIFEAMLLQGFPESYELLGSLTDQVTQVSDAVPPPLARAIALSIKEQLYGRVARMQRSLLKWFEKNGRSFPWRTRRSFLRVLIAEKLLQQTAANNLVIKAFNELTQEYPDCESLSTADYRAIRRTIAPLGFPYRAKELVALGRTLRDKHGRKKPQTERELMALPGVGDYTTRAVLSFSYGKDIAVVDTNVARFLRRYFGLKLPALSNPARNDQLKAISDALVPPGQSAEFNWAVLDLCSIHCKAHTPVCRRCPVSQSCSYFRQNAVGDKTA